MLHQSYRYSWNTNVYTSWSVSPKMTSLHNQTHTQLHTASPPHGVRETLAECSEGWMSPSGYSLVPCRTSPPASQLASSVCTYPVHQYTHCIKTLRVVIKACSGLSKYTCCNTHFHSSRKAHVHVVIYM